MADSDITIFAYADWIEKKPMLMGSLHVNRAKGKEFYAFEYDETWLNSSQSRHLLDPDLNLFKGRQYTPLGKDLFGLFADSCPDRWGRMLMNRREANRARDEQRKPRALTESDYLLGVFDEARMGALRFSTVLGGEFLASSKELATPPWTTLRKLENASFAFENDENGSETKWLNQLLAPGSSLGGARPKASVQAPDGSLWIAKFPSKHDEVDSGAWEMVVHDLAVMCEINVPEARLDAFSNNGSTFLVKRFDRSGKNRVHFASAMTLLGKRDGEASNDNTSYLDIAAFIKSNGAAPKNDLLELWKRIVFGMAVSNTDDHLRNHGFVLSDKGWVLSPIFDVNPSVYGNHLSLNVSQYDNEISFDLALETAEYYGLALNDAKKVVEEVKSKVDKSWRLLAKKYGLKKIAIDRMQEAFAMEYK